MRSEQSIFDDLGTVCCSAGYIHAIAYFSFRDNMVGYSGEMKAEDMSHMFSDDRFIRTESSTLIGLLLKGSIDLTLPAPEVLDKYVERTHALLTEIHKSMSGEFFAKLDPQKVRDPEFNPFASASVLREPIFYGGESAYSFQYRDLSLMKYAKDDAWLLANKGFSIQNACDVAAAVGHIQNDKMTSTMIALRAIDAEKWTLLPAFTFTFEEVVAKTGLDPAVVKTVLTSFSPAFTERNVQFKALHDFNIANALPLIRISETELALFNIYSFVEAIYESPFYWMNADKSYATTAMEHRGKFTEEFSAACLGRVFGKENVFANVDIFDKKEKVGEIDVLVVFGNRALVLQAKSKRLTLESRRGNDLQIKDDFKKSIQDSYDQAFKCAQMLADGRYVLRDSEARDISIGHPIKETYLACVVSDHYPALSFQARQFLRTQTATGVSPPFVLDVFTLDAMTEMLQSPLHFLSYVDRRTKYSDRVIASHELTVLSYHLKQNLWVSEEHQMMMLHDDISTDLDLAMAARRDGIAAKRTPDGILTRLPATTLGGFIRDIEARPDPGTIDLGFLLLTLNEDTVVEGSNGIDELIKRARADGRSHNMTLGFRKDGTGLTVHCNQDSADVAGPALQRYCHARKYKERAQTWFGVCVNPIDKSLRFGLNLDYAWERSAEMDALTKDMAQPSNLPDALRATDPTGQKVRSNDPCPCGSGKKYKRCCFLKK